MYFCANNARTAILWPALVAGGIYDLASPPFLFPSFHAVNSQNKIFMRLIIALPFEDYSAHTSTTFARGEVWNPGYQSELDEKPAITMAT